MQAQRIEWRYGAPFEFREADNAPNLAPFPAHQCSALEAMHFV